MRRRGTVMSSAVDGVRGSVYAAATSEGRRVHHEGHVATPHGYVLVFSDPEALNDHGWTSLRFIWRGRTWYYTEKRAHSPRGCAILAGRFVRDVVAGRVR